MNPRKSLELQSREIRENRREIAALGTRPAARRPCQLVSEDIIHNYRKLWPWNGAGARLTAPDGSLAAGDSSEIARAPVESVIFENPHSENPFPEFHFLFFWVHNHGAVFQDRPKKIMGLCANFCVV